jgi:Spy/CpxP family protein refolding chaperone
MIASRRCRIALVLPVLLLLSTLSLAAQGRPTDAGPGQPGPDHPVQVVAHFLQLSDTQIEQWVEILQGLHESVRPLAETVAQRERELATLVESDGPDPAEIGNLILEIRSLRQQIDALKDQATADFEALLDEEQQQRLATVRRVAPLARLLPAFQALYLL